MNIDVTSHGARGDGVADDTAAIQRAIDAAAVKQSAVEFPAGIYRTGRLCLRDNVALVGEPTFSYRRHGGTVLRLADERASCLLDLSGTFGVHVKGLALDGAKLGSGVHGIYLNGTGHQEEETICIDGVRIAGFSGDGLRLEPTWGFTVRNCLINDNAGDGIRSVAFDGYVYQNIIIGNGGWGFGGYPGNASATLTANRIEWNRKGGIGLHYGHKYVIGSNYIDRSGGPGIYALGYERERAHPSMTGTHAITGNVLYRSGKHAVPGSRESCHVRLEHLAGVTLTGNTCCYGMDDNGGGETTPSFGFVIEGLRNSVIAGNALNNACLAEVIRDFGGHSNLVLRDNPGSVVGQE